MEQHQQQTQTNLAQETACVGQARTSGPVLWFKNVKHT